METIWGTGFKESDENGYKRIMVNIIKCSCHGSTTLGNIGVWDSGRYSWERINNTILIKDLCDRVDDVTIKILDE